MSGNTSETRCKHCGGEEGHLVHHAGKGFKNAHKFEPTPPEGEAVPEQKRQPTTCIHCQQKIIPLGEYSWMHAMGNAMCNLSAAPVVSTAAPEPPQIKMQRYDPIAEIQEIANNLAKSGDCIDSLKLEAAINVLAPESYKPGTELSELIAQQGIKPMKTGHELEIPGLSDEDMEGFPGSAPAATPVTVEAPEKFHKTAIKILEWLEINKPDARFYQYSSDHVVKTVASIIEVAATPKPIGDTPKLKEFVQALLSRLAGLTDEQLSNIDETITCSLGPFFAPAPPCSECATPSDKWYMEYQAAVARAVQAEDECATLRKERDDSRSELFLSGVELTKQRSFAIVARLNAALWKGKLQAAEAQLSTLRDALEKLISRIEDAGVEDLALVEMESARAALAPTPEVAPTEGKV